MRVLFFIIGSILLSSTQLKAQCTIVVEYNDGTTEQFAGDVTVVK